MEGTLYVEAEAEQSLDNVAVINVNIFYLCF
jgi:hypothetical protein